MISLKIFVHVTTVSETQHSYIQRALTGRTKKPRLESKTITAVVTFIFGAADSSLSAHNLLVAHWIEVEPQGFFLKNN